MDMRVFRLLAMATSMLAVYIGPVVALQATELRVGGTGAAAELLRSLGESFSKHGVGVDVIPSLGSTGGISAVADGVIDVAVAARPLRPAELERGLHIALSTRTLFVFASSHPKPNGLTLPDLLHAYSSVDPRWADQTGIKVVLRPRSDSDTDLLAALFPGLGPAIEVARGRPDLPIAATDQDNAARGERLPGSLIASTLTQLVLEKRDLRPVTIDGVEPTLANFESGKYPHTKPLYFIVSAKKSPLTDSFLAFLQSSEGLMLLRQGFVIL